MGRKGDVILNRMIETRSAMYEGFFDHAWANRLLASSPPQLAGAVNRLCLAWKEASSTHRLPWLMTEQMASFADGFMRTRKSRLSDLLDKLKDWLVRELGRTLRRVDRKAVLNTVQSIDQRLRLADQQADVRFPVQGYWGYLVDQTEFNLSVACSQNLAYCAVIFAYEWFLVSCFRALGGQESHRPNYAPFWAEFTSLLGRSPKADYWDDRPVKIAREARNCIAHLGGEVKPELKAMGPSFWISPEEVISIQPADNHELFNTLKIKVSRLVEELAPKFAGPKGIAAAI